MLLEIVSPEAKLFSGEVTSVSLPGVDGSFQILNHHAPIVSTLKEGVVKMVAPSFIFNKDIRDKFIKVNEQNYTLSITSGTIEMKDNKVIVLVD
ncbi:F0F1 ATP synthase subunit epsilon [Flavobacterium luteum]|uniref:F0F1 ATP synthase subunit epsilon n=1 Tax=Flavobacterium luteum TaxID=2026654 RepID=A0A7J5AH12_9FLAO|nr:F0F1 ATP synthase subunit epsilon [Flavobacterium luteum]KAB1156897.1 F0F1 ATP synthase subunit epsilon [Flavobacterium luteum]